MRRVLLALAPGPDVSFRAADGTKLVGHVFGTGRKTMILGHQSQSNLCDWATYARRLARLGYTAFAIDFRGHGLSQHRQGAARNRLALDLARGRQDHASARQAPVLYLAAADDDNAGYDFSKDAEALYAATAAADKRLVILPGFLHGVGLVGASARTRSLIESFLKGTDKHELVRTCSSSPASS